jgi:Holliday junction resolvasome RuvABC endonuclease subunit
MRILGLDLSLRSTGYVLLDDQVLEDVVWHGRVDASDLEGVERLGAFDDWIRNVALPSQAGKPADVLALWRLDHVAIEGYSYGSPQAHTRAFGIGELGGVIKLAIHQAGIPMHIIAANTWKMQLCGKGGLAKDLCRLEIFKRYGVEFPSQDTLDAWAVAMTLRRQLLGLDKPAPKVKKPKAAPLLEAMA